jgi:predicted DNA binding protein
MPAFEVLLKTHIGNPIDTITGKYPSLRIWTWCNFLQEVHEIESNDPRVLRDALTEFREVYRVLDEAEISTSARMITQNCICTRETTVHDNIGELEILNIMPIFCEGGFEYSRLIAFRHEALSELFERLSGHGFRFEVEEKLPFNGIVSDTLIPLNSLMAKMTDRQIDAISAAYNCGYYQTPRRVNVETIANRVKVPRTTLQEHLNKAENKLISSIMPQIQMYTRKNRVRLSGSA